MKSTSWENRFVQVFHLRLFSIIASKVLEVATCDCNSIKRRAHHISKLGCLFCFHTVWYNQLHHVSVCETKWLSMLPRCNRFYNNEHGKYIRNTNNEQMITLLTNNESITGINWNGSIARWGCLFRCERGTEPPHGKFVCDQDCDKGKAFQRGWNCFEGWDRCSQGHGAQTHYPPVRWMSVRTSINVDSS